MKPNRCAIILTAMTVVVVVLVIGPGEIGLLVPPYKTDHVIKSDYYTEGDTDVNTFNPFYCKVVEMAKSEQSKAKLILYKNKPPLNRTDTLLANFSGTLKHEDSFSDWRFHIHNGSKMTLSICVHSKPTCQSSKQDIVQFGIILGKKNFDRWKLNPGDFKDYAIDQSRPLHIWSHYCHKPLTVTHPYMKDGDYWHVIRSSLYDCEVGVTANITVDRIQYYNDGTGVGDCELSNDQSSCSVHVTTTHSQYYAFLAVDGNETIVIWKNNTRVTLTCIQWDWFWGVGIGIVVLGVIIVATLWVIVMDWL